MTEPSASPSGLTRAQVWTIVAVVAIVVVALLIALGSMGDVSSGGGTSGGGSGTSRPVPTIGGSSGTPVRSPERTPSPASTNVPHQYENCAEAKADGRSNIPSGDPGYSPGLDGDGDGWACEKK